MKKIFNLIFAVAAALSLSAQSLQRPKLVVGIVIDQMRWDFLYRYYNRYADDGGFKRLISQGFSCENTFIPYAPTVTACGHASIYTGSVPSINGITGNFWWDYKLNKSVYCTEDSSVKTVGSNTTAGAESPGNLLTTTIGDELKLATNFQSKVIGVALKDRASILPAGHNANSAYWFDSKAGVWITSDYYMKTIPGWVKKFDSKKMIDSFYNSGWNTLYPLNTYKQSTADENTYESKPFGNSSKGFPYNLKSNAGNNYNIVLATPFGNTLTAEFAKQAVINEQLGADAITDLLAVSFSSPDYIGHSFGPNSVEQEDDYLRLDKDLGDLLNFLDNKIGKDQYIVFLSADHGIAHVPAFAKDHNIPSGSLDFKIIFDKMQAGLKEKFGQDNLILDIANYQVSLNLALIASSSLKITDIKNWIINYLSKQAGIDRVIDMDDFNKVPLNAKVKEMLANGYYPARSGQIQMILQPQWLEGFGNGGTTHGLWNPYDSHIPLLWYGWGIKPGKTNRETYMTDIAPTLAALLHIQMPSGTVGKVIPEIFK
ncbi:MAG TPA: alkaline phosphatase PafA [Chitinophagaceae bacterium]|nr:alkaline phosphatase PafA [Chitinophagaceae bacterium]